jgi:hypothetical protein
MQFTIACLTEGGIDRLRMTRQHRETFLVYIRQYVSIVAGNTAWAIGTQEDCLLAVNVFQHTTCSYYGAIAAGNLPEPYASGVKHRLMVYYHLCQLNAKSDDLERKQELHKWSEYGLMSLKKYLAFELGKTHPELAAKVLHEVRLTFIPRNDKDLPPDMPSPASNPGFYGFKR